MQTRRKLRFGPRSTLASRHRESCTDQERPNHDRVNLWIASRDDVVPSHPVARVSQYRRDEDARDVLEPFKDECRKAVLLPAHIIGSKLRNYRLRRVKCRAHQQACRIEGFGQLIVNAE